jgi:hypothetical protein
VDLKVEWEEQAKALVALEAQAKAKEALVKEVVDLETYSIWENLMFKFTESIKKSRQNSSM